MAILTVEGTYQDGRIELVEHPERVAGAMRVLVTFLPVDEAQERRESSAEAKRRLEAGRRLLARFERGIPFGGPPYPKREELYDRFDRSGSGPS
jgi:hypothetical protein